MNNIKSVKIKLQQITKQAKKKHLTKINNNKKTTAKEQQ